jgi:hypothetical protein
MHTRHGNLHTIWNAVYHIQTLCDVTMHIPYTDITLNTDMTIHIPQHLMWTCPCMPIVYRHCKVRQTPMAYAYDTQTPMAYAYDTQTPMAYAYDTQTPMAYAYDTYTPMAYAYDTQTPMAYAYDTLTAVPHAAAGAPRGCRGVEWAFWG